MIEHRKHELSPIRRTSYIFIIIASVFLIYFFALRDMRFFRVPSGSMAPTLVPPEYFMTLNEKEYGRGDVVVLKDPELAGGYLVKRIVAIGGDQVMLQNGALYINDVYMSEPYIIEPAQYNLKAPYDVGVGEVYVLGDNRNNSEDSHIWESGVPADKIVGKVYFVYLPLSQGRCVRSYPLTVAQGT
jgi:signal peptidase I